MKKILALVLALILTLSVSVIAFAANPDVGGGNGDGEISWDEIVNAGIVKGDLSGDKTVTAYDARIALKKAASIEATSSKDLKIADFDNNGVITSYDARQILKLAVK